MIRLRRFACWLGLHGHARDGYLIRPIVLAVLVALAFAAGVLLAHQTFAASRPPQQPGFGSLLPSPSRVAAASPLPSSDPLPPHVATSTIDVKRSAHSSLASVKGRRWHTIFATWYGPGLYGNRTSDGTVLEPSSVWVAMNGLPLGASIEVRYHGVTLRLQVRDRHGHTPGGRDFLDLTARAAELLGHRFSGPVQWRVAR